MAVVSLQTGVVGPVFGEFVGGQRQSLAVRLVCFCVRRVCRGAAAGVDSGLPGVRCGVGWSMKGRTRVFFVLDLWDPKMRGCSGIVSDFEIRGIIPPFA